MTGTCPNVIHPFIYLYLNLEDLPVKGWIWNFSKMDSSSILLAFSCWTFKDGSSLTTFRWWIFYYFWAFVILSDFSSSLGNEAHLQSLTWIVDIWARTNQLSSFCSDFESFQTPFFISAASDLSKLSTQNHLHLPALFPFRMQAEVPFPSFLCPVFFSFYFLPETRAPFIC